MSWESKFSSIVQETEANLAKVKEKLRGKQNNSPTSVSFDRNYYHDYSTSLPRLSSPVHHYPVSSTPKSRFGHYNDSTVGYSPRSSLATSPQPNTLQLQEKIDRQTKTIDELTRHVRSLEKERGEYQDQIRQLRSEVSTLSSQVLEHGKNPHLEWQMDQMKRTLMREVQEVRDQLKLFRMRVDRQSSSDRNSSVSIIQDIDEVRLDIEEELQYVKKDLDVLRKRLGSVELGVMASHYDKRELERSQDRMNKSLREITNGRTRNLVDVLKTCPDADRSLDRVHVDQLRSTVQSLKDKLDSVETRLQSTKSPWKPDFQSKTHKQTVRSTYDVDVDVDIDSDIDDDDDDIDSDNLSDDLEDSDIELSSSHKKFTSTKKVRIASSREPDQSDDEDNINTTSFNSVDLEEDDLDIDDLDIDDDDDIDV